MSGSTAVTVNEFLRRSEQTLLRLNAEGCPIALTRGGRSVAVLVDLDTYARLARALAREECRACDCGGA